MSIVTTTRAQQAAGGACHDCRRRGWLLGRLSKRLDYHSRDEARLLDLLALGDERLIEAIGGKWRRRLREEWERFEADAAADVSAERGGHGGHDGADDVANPAPSANDAIDGAANPTPSAQSSDIEEQEASRAAKDATAQKEAEAQSNVQTVCPHHTCYPSSLREHPGAPRMLFVSGGGAQRLASLMSQPAVAIVGSVHPTDYGMEMARSLARGLSVSGVTILSGFANGIAAAAHDGALQAGGATVTVMAGGVDVVTPAGRRRLYERVIERGCAVSERPCGFAAWRWCELARARTIAMLAQLTIVVEAGASPAELRLARVACRLGRPVVAIPGRVTSPASVGTNMLLMAGAPLVRGPEDALEALARATCPIARPPGTVTTTRSGHPALAYPSSPTIGPHWPEVEALLTRDEGASRTSGLEPRLRSVLEQVGAGRDTPGRLAAAGADPAEAMLALSELELLGLLGRGDGGRYVPRQGLTGG